MSYYQKCLLLPVIFSYCAAVDNNICMYKISTFAIFGM